MSLDIVMDYALKFAEDVYYDRNNRLVAQNARIRARRNEQDRRNRARDKLKLVIAIVVRCYLIYLFLANLSLGQTKVEVDSLDVASLNVKYNIASGNSIREEGNTSLRVALKVTGHFNPSPEYVSLNLSTIGILGHPISTFSRSTFKIFKYGNQLIVANFEPHPTDLSQEQLEVFHKYFKDGKLAIRLNVDFKWKLDKRMFLVFPTHYEHTSVICDIPYELLPIDGRRPLRCI